MQEIFDLIVFEHIVMIDEMEYDMDNIDTQLSLARKQELDARLSRYKDGEPNFYSWKDIKDELDSN